MRLQKEKKFFLIEVSKGSDKVPEKNKHSSEYLNISKSFSIQSSEEEEEEKNDCVAYSYNKSERETDFIVGDVCVLYRKKAEQNENIHKLTNVSEAQRKYR